MTESVEREKLNELLDDYCCNPDTTLTLTSLCNKIEALYRSTPEAVAKLQAELVEAREETRQLRGSFNKQLDKHVERETMELTGRVTQLKARIAQLEQELAIYQQGAEVLLKKTWTK